MHITVVEWGPLVIIGCVLSAVSYVAAVVVLVVACQRQRERRERTSFEPALEAFVSLDRKELTELFGAAGAMSDPTVQRRMRYVDCVLRCSQLNGPH